METIGERIIHLRDSRDISQAGLARLVGISKMTLYKYEKGLSEPRGDTIARIADVLNTTADYLLGRTSSSAPIIRNGECVKVSKLERGHLEAYRQLNAADKIRVDERITVFLEQSQKK